MWGCISTDYIYQSNFNTGFSSMKSDILIHLTQWQYWWWFWFSFLWVLYYLFINKTIRARVLKMKPKIATSFRAHGKWGDFVACVIPSIWCLNILTNSNFILRLIEWQGESSIFTVRIRGRQWYWVYKFELKQIFDLYSIPKNIGNNKWVVNINGSNEVSTDYSYAFNLRAENVKSKKLWSDFFLNEQNKNNFITNNNLYVNKGVNQQINLKNFSYFNYFLHNFNKQNYWDNKTVISNKKLSFFFNKFSLITKDEHFFEGSNKTNFFFLQKLGFVKKKNILVNLNFKNPDIFDSSRFLKKKTQVIEPVLIKKIPLILSKNKPLNLFDLEFNGKKNVEQKISNNQQFFVLKQKRYKRKKIIPVRTKYYRTDLGFKTNNFKFSDRPFLISNAFFDTFDFDPTTLYNLLKKNKVRSEVMSVQLSRRMLRTKKTLVLPAHVNISLITNSYDVIHSWFIPGLGIKLDCVPGRSTHHTFYCDNLGFYYGQCAEICGRYHHHMPIRLCVLPFEHFIVWWQHFGLPKMLNTYNKSKFESSYSFKKFSW